MRLAALSIAWIIGVCLGSITSIPWVLLLIMSGGALAVALLLRRRKTLLWAALCLFVLPLGAGCFSWRVGPPTVVALNDEGPAIIRGEVAKDATFHGTTTSFSMDARLVFQDGRWEPVGGKVLVITGTVPAYALGDCLELRGEPQSLDSIGDEGYRQFLVEQGFSSRMIRPQVDHIDTGWLFEVRNRLGRSLSSVIPEPEASLAKALLLGMRSQIPESMRQDFYRSGTSHILAISGLHMAVVGGLVLALAAWIFGRHRPNYLVLTLAVIWLFASMTGMAPPVLRAAIMFSLFIVALWLGRPDSGMSSLALAAAVMVGISPLVLFSVSFQLSCASVAGLILIFRPIHRWGEKAASHDQSARSTAFRYILNGLAVSFAAVMATLPLLLYHFGAISLLALPATFAAALFLPGAILLTLVTAVLGFVAPPVASVFGWSAWLFLWCMTGLIHAFGSMRFAMVDMGRPGVAVIWAYYSVLAVILAKRRLTLWSSSLKTYLQSTLDRLADLVARMPKKRAAVVLIVVASLTWLAALAIPTENRLEVHFLDVGHGDSILVETPTGQQVLIDGGPDPNKLCVELDGKLPFWDRSIDLVILTHPHEDHLVGLLEVLCRYQVGLVLESGYEEACPAYTEWCRLIFDGGIEQMVIRRGQCVDLGGGVLLDIIHPPDQLIQGTDQDANNNSVAIRLVWNKISFLLTGDLCEEGENHIIHYGRSHYQESTVLKVAHHGSNSSTSEHFLEVVNPQVAVICVGDDNTFGHPSPLVLERLGDIPVYRTDLQGTVSFTTDGERLWVDF